MPAAESAANDFGEKPASVPRLPLRSATRKNIGSPSGTVIAMAWPTVPVKTPRRTLALLKAKVAAEQIASRAPSNAAFLVGFQPRGSGRRASARDSAKD